MQKARAAGFFDDTIIIMAYLNAIKHLLKLCIHWSPRERNHIADITHTRYK